VLHINKMVAKKPYRVVVAIAERLSYYLQALRRSISYHDNGSENIENQKINQTLSTKSNFCNF